MHQSQVNMCFLEGTEKPKNPSKFEKAQRDTTNLAIRPQVVVLGLLSDRM